jgi:hypothetical protein
MKRLALIVLILLALVVPAQATQTTATFGDKNSSNVYRVQADTDGVVTFASDTAIKYPYSNYTVANTAKQLVTTDSGKVFTDYGGVTANSSAPATKGMGSVWRLPPTDAVNNTTTLGTVYTISTGSQSYITVDTFATTDIILDSISGTGFSAGYSALSSGQAGDSLKLMNTGAGIWTVVERTGTWTNNGTN